MLWSLPADVFRLDLGAELRYRLERRSHTDFSGTTGGTRGDALFRGRAGVKLSDGAWSGELQYQFSDDRFWKPGQDLDPHNSDLRLGYARWKGRFGDWTVGRQLLLIGDQRLIGSSDWNNVGRTFDVVDGKFGKFEAFGGKIGVASPYPTEARIYGLTYRPGGSKMLAFFQKHDELATGNTDASTLDALGKWSFHALKAEVEIAGQRGSVPGKTLSAYAGHAKLSGPIARTSGAFIEGNLATGGSGPNTSRTFDNLYPSNHPNYGVMDLQGWRNMEEFVLGADRRLAPALLVKLSFHHFWLLDSSDAWYAATGQPNARPGGTLLDSTGASGRDVGQEWDLETSWKPRREATYSGGVGWFRPGPFVNHVLGGKSDAQTWMYLQAEFKF